MIIEEKKAGLGKSSGFECGQRLDGFYWSMYYTYLHCPCDENCMNTHMSQLSTESSGQDNYHNLY